MCEATGVASHTKPQREILAQKGLGEVRGVAQSIFTVSKRWVKYLTKIATGPLPPLTRG